MLLALKTGEATSQGMRAALGGGKGWEWILPWSLQKGSSPAHTWASFSPATLIWDSDLENCKTIHLCYFSPEAVVMYHSNHKKLMHYPESQGPQAARDLRIPRCLCPWRARHHRVPPGSRSSHTLLVPLPSGARVEGLLLGMQGAL